MKSGINSFENQPSKMNPLFSTFGKKPKNLF